MSASAFNVGKDPALAAAGAAAAATFGLQRPFPAKVDELAGMVAGHAAHYRGAPVLPVISVL